MNRQNKVFWVPEKGSWKGTSVLATSGLAGKKHWQPSVPDSHAHCMQHGLCTPTSTGVSVDLTVM